MIVSRAWSNGKSEDERFEREKRTRTRNLINKFVDESCKILSYFLNQFRILFIFHIQITQCAQQILMIDRIRGSFDIGFIQITEENLIETVERWIFDRFYQYRNTSRSANNSKIRIKSSLMYSLFFIRRTFSCFTSIASLMWIVKSSKRSLKWKSPFDKDHRSMSQLLLERFGIRSS